MNTIDPRISITIPIAKYTCEYSIDSLRNGIAAIPKPIRMIINPKNLPIL